MGENKEKTYREDNWTFNPEIDLPICNKCIFYLKGLHCKAFPEPNNIPDEILDGKNKHEKIIDGQTGDFIFTPIEKE